MSTSIFIKTCKKDLEWLKFCLESIGRFGSGFDELVILADDDCHGLIEPLTPANWKSRVEYCEKPPKGFGYFHQEACKLMADTYVPADNIMFVDSDCVFFKPFTPNDFMRDGKPILIKTRYSTLEKCPAGKAALCWREPTEKIVGCSLEWEYMRRIPMIFRREIYAAIREKYPHVQKHVRGIRGFGGFSEFNLMGAYIELYDPDSHFITDSEVWTPEVFLKQNWSWGGLTPEVKAEILEILK